MRLWFMVSLALFSSLSFSESFYAELSGDVMLQSVGDERFRPSTADARLGVYPLKQIGLEVFAGGGLTGDTSNGLEQEVGSRYGISTRWESPSRDGTKAFILLGYAKHELELSRESNGQSLVKEEFDGFAYGVGIEQQLFSKTSCWFVNARWQRFYSAGDVDIDGIGVALRWIY